MVKVENRIVQNKLTYKGEVILKYKIEFPQIRGNERFNMYNYNNALRLQQLCEKELYEQAKKVYDYNQENRYPLMIFEIIKEYVVTYNYNNIISIYSDEYIFEGGAHGNTLRYSQNWNLQQGRMIDLSELYKRNPNYVSEILKEINNQIKQKLEELKKYKPKKSTKDLVQESQNAIEELRKKKNRILKHLYRHVYRMKKAFPAIDTTEIREVLSKKIEIIKKDKNNREENK